MIFLLRCLRTLGCCLPLLGVVTGVGIAVSIAGASVATAQAITVEGNRRVEADTIRSYFRPGPGERLDAVKIDQAYKALVATGLFQDVRVSQAGGRLVVYVVEAPVINRIAFEGNRRVKDEQIAAEIGSKPRGTFSRAQVQADAARIVDIYRANGRYNVRVDPQIIELPNNRVDLVFEIRDGEKTAVKVINFVGARAFSDRRLRDVIKTAEAGILSILKNNDIYDADRIEADRDLLRRFYLSRGYADVRIVSAVSEFDPGRNGFVITFTIDEGEPYRFGAVEVISNVRDVDPTALRSRLRASTGSLYSADAIEKSVEEMTIELARRGYAFAQVRPRGERDPEGRLINVSFVVEEGSRAYIERINVRGNSRTRDYVIRREFDIAEGDAYNRAMVDRAERRLKNLAYFKSVKISSEPGSSPDRVVLNVDVEEQSTGEFSVSGGYSTTDGFMGEVSVGERNLLGRGQYAKIALTYGQFSRGFETSFVEPYFLGYRVALGVDAFAKQQQSTSYQSYGVETVGGAVRLGLPLRDDLSIQLRYSAYQQEIQLSPTNDCFPASATCVPASAGLRETVARGAQLVSLVGYTLNYNTLNQNRNPTSGLFAEIRQDLAGAGGDVRFLRTSGEARYYYEVMPELIAMTRLQGGHIMGWGGQTLRMIDHFVMGPNLVRGFAPAGLGPRELTPGSTQDALGGTMYWAATLELQHPLWFAPKDFGLRAAVFADAGSLWNYRGVTSLTLPGQGTQVISPLADSSAIRSSVGAGLIWDSPFGPLRFDYAVALTKESYDRVQQFRFSGGTKF